MFVTIFFLLVLFGSGSYAEVSASSTTFFRVYDHLETKSEGEKLLERGDGGFYIGVSEHDGKEDPYWKRGKMSVFSADSNGKIESSTQLSFGLSDGILSMVKNEERILVASSRTPKHSDVYSRNDTVQDFPTVFRASEKTGNKDEPLVFHNLNPMGYVWNGQHLLGSANGLDGRTSLAAAPDGGIFLSGSVHCCAPWYRDHHDKSLKYTDSAFVQRLDSSGKKIKERVITFGDELRAGFLDSFYSPKSGLILAGKLEQILKFENPFLARLDADLKTIWNYHYSGYLSQFKGSVYTEAKALVEGDFPYFYVLSEMAMGERGTSGGAFIKSWQPLLMKVSAESGDVVWYASFWGRGSAKARAVRVADDGNVVIVGDTYGMKAEYHRQDTDIFIAKFSSKTGEELWHRYYGTPQDDEANALTISNSGFMSVTGSVAHWEKFEIETIVRSGHTFKHPKTTERGSKLFLLRANSEGLVEGMPPKP